MSHTHSLAEWASVLSGAIGVHASYSVLWFLLVDASRKDFDPRPAVRRALESGRYDRLLIAVGPAMHDVVRATVRAFKALAALLIPTAPEATR